MKKLILLFLLSTMQIFAQDYSKNSAKELLNIIKSKDSEIAKLQKNSSEIKSINEKSVINIKNEKDSLFTILNNVNEIFLLDIFIEKYNEKYFLETDLLEDKTEKIKNSRILISSIKATSKDQNTKELCQKALDFETNYSLLYDIKKTVFANKYNKEGVDLAIKNIEALPSLMENSKLNISKKNIVDLLKNYAFNTCELRKNLVKYKKASDQNAIQNNYKKLETDSRFSSYAYLINVIREMKKNVNSFSDDLDIDCEPFKEAEPQPIKQ